MTLTIEERIEAATDELFRPEEDKTNFVETLQRHFAEPWLGAPDGPGWWWRREASLTTVILITSADDLDEMPRLAGVKWQRVIGPQ